MSERIVPTNLRQRRIARRERRALNINLEGNISSRLRRRPRVRSRLQPITKDETTNNNDSLPTEKIYPPQLLLTIKEPEVIDLVVSTKQCAICSNVLGQGSSIMALIYVYEHCGCVSSYVLTLLTTN